MHSKLDSKRKNLDEIMHFARSKMAEGLKSKYKGPHTPAAHVPGVAAPAPDAAAVKSLKPSGLSSLGMDEDAGLPLAAPHGEPDGDELNEDMLAKLLAAKLTSK